MSIPSSALRLILLPLLLLAGLGALPAAQPQATDVGTSASLAARADLFRIGFLRREETGHPGEEHLEVLRQRLLADEDLGAELKAAGYTGIGIYSCDGASDMLRRLNAREFDVAFTPASLYLQQQGGYTPMLMARRRDDIFNPNGKVFRHGVLIVSPRSPLFAKDNAGAEEVRAALAADPRLSVVSTQSVAGFHAPLLSLDVKFGVSPVETSLLWFETSEEVVKAVLSGLADMGACEEAAIDRVLAADGLGERRGELIKVLVMTDPIPPDPVVVRAGLLARNPQLLRTMSGAIREYSKTGALSGIQYINADDRDYGRLQELMKEFNSRIGQLSP